MTDAEKIVNRTMVENRRGPEYTLQQLANKAGCSVDEVVRIIVRREESRQVLEYARSHPKWKIVRVDLRSRTFKRLEAIARELRVSKSALVAWALHLQFKAHESAH